MTRVLIAGGGTGGHLFPGLAVADALRARGAQVSFVGTRRGLEARVVPQHGYALDFVDVVGLKGKGARALRDVLRLPGALLATLALLRRLRPDVVVGVGGYASGPVVLAAALRGLPTAVLEQNSVPGVTNRLLGRVVRQVFTAFPEAAAYFPRGKLRLLGNPIRQALAAAAGGPRPAERPPGLLVLGGSQGARAVNDLVTEAVAALVRAGQAPPRILHQTGRDDEEPVRARYAALSLGPPQVTVKAFVDDMAAAYAECDLCVGRAGATTLAEIAALGLPSILIPFPHAADDHQTRNARYLEAEGAALVLTQAEAAQRPGALAELLGGLLRDPAARETMAARSRRLGHPEAAQAVCAAILALCGAAA